MKAAKLIEDIRAMVKAPALHGAPAPVRIDVGERAHWLISDAAGWRSVHEGRLLPALFGVPIEPTGDLLNGFAVWAAGGEVLAEGDLEL